MAETWFRGEGVGVKQAAGRTNPHDFVDGLYFADNLTVANTYAEDRAPDPANRRVYSVNIDTSSMRVLDLTKDPRWTKPIVPGGPTRDNLIAGTTNENYGRIFKEWKTLHKIDLDQYDAIIGMELLRKGPNGSFGRQLCIIDKGQRPWLLADKLRSMFSPILRATPVPSSPPGTLKFGGKIGPGMKIAGRTMLGSGISFLISYLLGKVIQKIVEDFVQRQTTEKMPQIKADLGKKKEVWVTMLAAGKTSYATMRFSAETTQMNTVEGWADSFPKINYLGLEITESPVAAPNAEGMAFKDDGSERENFLAPGAMLERKFYKVSAALGLSAEELELYRQYKKEIEWYDSEAQFASAPDRERLFTDRTKLINKFKAAMAE